MADSKDKRQSDLEGLLAERKKYETWLAQLEAKRPAAAEHVFVRVHADYSQRLGDVRTKLAGEAVAIAALVAELEARLSGEHDAVTARTDERAEAELRAMVGEFSDKEWNSAREKLDDAIAELRASFDATERELSDLKDLLNSVSGESPPARPSAQQSAAAIVDDDIAEASGSEDATEKTDSALDSTEDVGFVQLAGGFAAAEEVSSEAEHAESNDLPEIVAGEDSGEVPGEPDLAEGTPSLLSSENAAESADDTSRFDELAFLRSVAGTPANSGSATVINDNPEPRRSGAIAPERGRGTIDEPAPAPAPRPSAKIADPESDDPSPLGAPTPRTSQAVRSLKCQECGTLNFPTEWYCERCGGELAAF